MFAVIMWQRLEIEFEEIPSSWLLKFCNFRNIFDYSAVMG